MGQFDRFGNKLTTSRSRKAARGWVWLAGELAAPADEDGMAVGQNAWYYWLLLPEGRLNRKLLGQMMRWIAALPVAGG